MAIASDQDTQELLRLAIGPACHELRSPLAVVYGFARMLEGDDALSETHTRYISQIVRGAERLDAMLDDLSKLGRTAAGRVQPRIESVSMRAIAEDLGSAAVNAGRLRIDSGPDVTLKGDGSWLSESLQAIVDGLCFEEGIDVMLTWRQQHPGDVVIQVVPNSTFPMVDVEPEKSSLGISLARMRVVAMGGTFDGGGDRITITLTAG
jgi:light-regulated signal transduction histidine kinase (bacteriophytochrome)